MSRFELISNMMDFTHSCLSIDVEVKHSQVKVIVSLKLILF